MDYPYKTSLNYVSIHLLEDTKSIILYLVLEISPLTYICVSMYTF